MSKVFKSGFFYLALAGVALLAIVLASGDDPAPDVLRLDQYEDMVAAGNVKTAELVDGDDVVNGNYVARGRTREYEVTYPREYSDDLTALLVKNNVSTKVAKGGNNILVSLLWTVLPIMIVFLGFLFIMNKFQGGGGRLMQFGRAKTKQMSKDQTRVTFADVAGANEAVADLQEIKEFLEAPEKFQAMGAQIPKGVLLFGPPGTGKTLLARAVAGEAGVPFFSISGSDFVEMFVGVGASRVRDLFEQAKSNAPAIIFMDEIDAVGRHRGAGIGGGHDEREQTLNQLLVEMDGFDARTGVIMIAATNRPDILDPALLRPGRFDRQIVVDRPDLEGRIAILKVHAKDKPLAEDVEVEVVARRTPGFTGADLANLLNEAALLAARENMQRIGMHQLEEAIDRVIAGPERSSRVMSDDEKRIIAYHEGGHALVGHVLSEADPVHKVSIVARGRALGWTLSLPTEDKHLQSRTELCSQMAVLLGGRTAEEMIFDEPTTGASNDIEKATQIARAMVTAYGMSDKLGPLQFGQKNGETFLGRDMGHQADYSDEVAAGIDSEIRRLVEDAHDEALAILRAHRETLDSLAAALIEKETLDNAAFLEVVKELPEWQLGSARSNGHSKEATSTSQASQPTSVS